MDYVPHTEEDVKEMLQRIGKGTIEDLFDGIPPALRLTEPLDLPVPLSEEALRREMQGLANRNTGKDRLIHFLGGGAYDHLIPAPVWHLLGRTEFYSAYTPYQPEISQGTLQGLFEFQTLICQLTGMEVANASMYDGASSAAEAVLMALRMTKKERVLIAESVHPEYREVIHTYCQYGRGRLETIPVGPEGVTRTEGFDRAGSSDDLACVVVQSPNFLGCVEPVKSLGQKTHERGGLLIQITTEPLSLAILAPPGEAGADIAVGELQSFGIPLQFGGPYAGFFATRKAFVRNMPGRIVGETEDRHGKRGFVLTLSTREQHIRRAKATSNICTNHNLCALASTVYLALLGKRGIRELALLNLSKAEYAKQRLRDIQGIVIPFSTNTFNEFVIQLPVSCSPLLDALQQEEGVLAGIPLGRYYRKLEGQVLICVTEKHRKEDIDLLAEALKKRCQKK
jgi:glycine dehydrogenase subunit 1